MRRTSAQKQRDDAHRADWLATFEATVCAAAPGFAGRIEWADATFLYNSGRSVDAAAARYLANRSQEN